MPPESVMDFDDDAARLWDMLNASRHIVSFTQGRTFADYCDDLQFRSAVERQIEIIGEAARTVSDEFKEQHTIIPWRKIVVQRHVLAHEYGQIDNERLWGVATVHVPELISLLEPLIPPEPPVVP